MPAINFPKSTYTAAEGVSAHGWAASPSNGDTDSENGRNFTFSGTRSLWVLNTNSAHSVAGAATYTFDGFKWTASNIPDSSNTIFTSDTPLDGEVLKFESSGSTFVFDSPQNLISAASASQNGVMTAAQFTKLAGIETGATADLTAAEIKTAYESNSDTNEFSDAEQTKLAGIETAATADQTAAEIKTLYESNSDTNEFSNAEQSKLAGIAAGAEVNVATNLSVSTTATTNVIASSTGTNATINEATGSAAGLMSTTHHNKLDNIEAAADVTDATNVDAAGAVMNSDTSTASMSFVVDEDNMSSNSATKVPTQQSVKSYVDNQVASVVDTAPAALDTLNELAAALGDDANFSTTVSNSIGTKLPLSGGTMTGNIVMSGSQTVDGRDLSADGAKLDGIASGAQVNVATNLSQAADENGGIEIRSSTGTNTTIPMAAAATQDGLMSKGDKAKLNGIATGAEVNVQSDWNATIGDAAILNKPTIPAAYTNSSVDAHLNQSSASTGQTLIWNGSDYSWGTPAASYGNSNVDSHLNRSSASTGQSLTWNGSDYAWATVSGSGGDADTVDGIHASSFLRSDASDISTGGTLEIRGGTAANEAQIKLDATQAGSPQIGFGDERDNTGDNYWAIGADDTDVSYFKFATRNNTGIPSVNGNTSSEVKFTIEYDGNLWAGPQNVNKIWHAGNDGSGSGLDADTVDGVHASSFAQLSGATFTGDLRVDNDADLRIGDGAANERILIQKADNNVSDHIIFYNGTTRMGEIGCQDTSWLRINQVTAKNIYTPRYIRADGGFFVDGASYGINGSGVLISNTGATIGGSTAWHAGNDGSGSGLDADTVDGIQGSALAPIASPTFTGNLTIPGSIVHAGDTDTYIQFHGGNLFRVVIAGAEVQEWGNNYTLLSDNDQLRLGSGSDFRMWFNGADTYFRNYAHGNGDIIFQGETSAGSNQNIHILKTDSTRTYNILYENSQERFRTTSAGVTVTGALTATGNVTAYSDVRLKTNIEVISNALDKVSQIRGVTFDRTDTGIKQSGVIAQEVEKVLPEVVTTGENDMKSVAYGNMNGLLIEAIKELRAEVADLKSQLGVS